MNAVAPFLQDHVERHPHAYASGVLNPKVHWRLVEAIDVYARTAGITPDHVWQPLAETCKISLETDYVRELRRHSDKKVYGFVYFGRFRPPVSYRMCAMAGAFLRNFIDARVVMTDSLITALYDGEEIDPAVLLIPDLVAAQSGLRSAQARTVAGLLEERHMRGRQTVVGVAHQGRLGEVFGADLTQVIEKRYMKLWGSGDGGN